MPTYPYRCDDCNNDVDVTKPMSKATRHEYCDCGSLMRRVYTPVAFTWGDSCIDLNESETDFAPTHHL